MLVATLVFLVLGGFEAWRDSATFDEPVYVSSGVAALLHHDVADNAEHPPLFKVLAALPVLIAHPVVPADGHWNRNNERTYSARFVEAQMRAGTMHRVTFASRLVPLLEPLGLKILVEPGRFIVGNAGILVTRVEYVKRTGKKNFVIVDAAMNDLIRPAFYDSYHEIVPLKKTAGKPISSDVVGGICESGDYFCKDRPLAKVGAGDQLALLSAGAYGFVMASNYNTRPLAAEVLVNGKKFAVARERQPVKEIWAGEKIVAWLK